MSKWREFWIKKVIPYDPSDVSVFESEIALHEPDLKNVMWGDFKDAVQVIEIGALREAQSALETEKARGAKLIYVLEQSRHALQMMIIHSGGADPDEEEKEARDNALETRNMISTTISQYKVESK